MKDFLNTAFEYFFDHGLKRIKVWQRQKNMPRCIGFLSKNSVCDTCASDFGRTSSVLITSFHKKQNTVFDACRADFGLKIAFATPVYRILVENDSFA